MQFDNNNASSVSLSEKHLSIYNDVSTSSEKENTFNICQGAEYSSCHKALSEIPLPLHFNGNRVQKQNQNIKSGVSVPRMEVQQRNSITEENGHHNAR